jgi:C-terminal processing protease CtpA/Prc
MDVKSDKQKPVAFAANMKIDYEGEKEQIFEEAWRSLEQRFYDPNFHGKDWDKLKKKYKPWAMKASTYYDFRDITNYMLGELNASHMDLRGGRGRYDTQRVSTGRLGIEVKPVKDGVEITDVVFNAPADKSLSKLNVGEVISSVNGVKITDEVNFWSLLEGDAGKEVLLEVAGPNGNREVVIRPASSLRNELYEDWVEERRKLTEQYSGGRLGYLHIQGMNWSSFERFERDLAAAGNGKEGIVIDVRFNGGGWTTDFLMTVLNVDQHAYCVPRGAAESLEKEHKNFRPYYPYGERLPYYAWTKPSIALCNESSYSNAEIFSHAYKTLGIGTLVGQPTFGAVISTGANGLLDGSYIRLPFRAWYVKATDENMEHGPAVPDILVETAPDAKAKGKDEQLQKAVEELLNQIDNQ